MKRDEGESKDLGFVFALGPAMLQRRMPKRFYHVYILTNAGMHPLYVGVTGFFDSRIAQHQAKLLESYTKRYNLTRLVYYEAYFSPTRAIAREKQLKGWRREKKMKLIE